MGLVFKMMVPIVIMILIYGYMMGGDKVMGFLDQFSKESFSRENLTGVEGISNAVTDEAVTVYQWVDEKGVKHFSNSRPAGQAVDELRMSPNANVIQSVKAVEEKAEAKQGGQVISILKSPYSPGGGKEIMDKTQGLKSTLDKRTQDQQKMMDQIMGNKK